MYDYTGEEIERQEFSATFSRANPDRNPKTLSPEGPGQILNLVNMVNLV
jgi:hypothetical protein